MSTLCLNWSVFDVLIDTLTRDGDAILLYQTHSNVPIDRTHFPMARLPNLTKGSQSNTSSKRPTTLRCRSFLDLYSTPSSSLIRCLELLEAVPFDLGSSLHILF